MSNYYVRLKGDSDGDPGRLPWQKLRVFCIFSALLNLGLLWLLMARLDIGNTTNEPHIYSPAQDVIRYKITKFTRGVANDIPIYERRPSPAVDEAWTALYSAQTKLPRSEALKMPNRTWPLPGEPGSYIFALDVFHQLHCLDYLRKQLSPGYNHTQVSHSHVRHCVGAIRQALMCSADISTIVWQWSDKHQMAEQRDDIVHVCRDFDRIRDWAAERSFEGDVDLSLYIENDLPVF
ncbi:hypothetical protein C8J57DRAFT_1344653 [Mycena rebaudengoi]|nr:hypothetical protein C8J57DRAFT_1344653 [Mycena rebaudengoi]